MDRKAEVFLNRLKKNFQHFTESGISGESTRAVWRASILSGQPLLVEAALRTDMTADSPLDDSGRPPLVELSHVVPVDSAQALSHLVVARCLIRHGAALALGDYKNLRPADHALISPNPALSQEIVLSTLRYFGERKNPDRQYRPNIGALFSTIVPEGDRERKYNFLCLNIREIRAGIQQGLAGDDRLLRDLPGEQHEFWSALAAPPYNSLPRPTATILAQFNKLQDMKRHSGPAAAMEDAQDRLRLLEWQHAGNFKPL